jgi:hypothetical protein
MKSVYRIAPLFLFPYLLFGAGGDRIGFLKGDHIFIADADGSNARQIDSDPRWKDKLRWDAARQRLGCEVERRGDEMSRFVVMDLSGKLLKEVAIRPVTDPPTRGMRFVEDIEWLPNGRIRVSGSVNPYNFEMFDLDIDTGQESNWQFGAGPFVPSPDREHMALRGPTDLTDEEHRFDTVLVDRRPDPLDPMFHEVATIHYDGEDPGIFVLAGPVWSPDSQHIAVIEKKASDQQVAVVILTPTNKPGRGQQGSVRRVWIPPSTVEETLRGRPWAPLRWIGTKVVAGRGTRAIAVDSASANAQFTRIVPEDLVQLTALEREESDATSARKNLEDLVKRLGGRGGVALATREPRNE